MIDYSRASLEELYNELSTELGGAFGLGDGTPDQGQTLFMRIWDRVSNAVCGNDFVRVLVEDRQAVVADQITLGALLATQFTPVVGNLVNVTLLVAIATRLGIKVLCAAHWSEPKSNSGS